jgi:beta-N-acetylhexosaminidase
MSKIARMTLEQKVGQMFVTYAYGPSVDRVDERNRTTYGVDSFRQLIERYHLGGIIYFAWSDNVRARSRSPACRTGSKRSPPARARRSRC